MAKETIDWQGKFGQLYMVIDPLRSFPASFDWGANADALIADARIHARTLGQLDAADTARREKESALLSARAKIKGGEFDKLSELEKEALQAAE